MRLKIALIALVAILASSCSSIKNTASTQGVASTVETHPTVTDLEVSTQKVSKTVSWGIPFFNKISLNTRKTNLVAELVNENNADILVEPQYIVEKGFLGSGKLTVIGYPAKFKDFRKATPSDIEAIKAFKTDTYVIKTSKK